MRKTIICVVSIITCWLLIGMYKNIKVITNEIEAIRIDTQDIRMSTASMNLRDKYGLNRG